MELDVVAEEEAEVESLPERVVEETVEAEPIVEETDAAEGEVEPKMPASVPVEPLPIHDANVWDDDVTWNGESSSPAKSTERNTHWEETAPWSQDVTRSASTTEYYGLHAAHAVPPVHLRGQQHEGDSKDHPSGGGSRQVL